MDSTRCSVILTQAISRPCFPGLGFWSTGQMVGVSIHRHTLQNIVDGNCPTEKRRLRVNTEPGPQWHPVRGRNTPRNAILLIGGAHASRPIATAGTILKRQGGIENASAAIREPNARINIYYPDTVKDRLIAKK